MAGPDPAGASSTPTAVNGSRTTDPNRSDPHGRHKDRKVLLIAGVVVAVLIVAGGIGAFAVSRQSKATYDTGTESRFMDACTANGGDPVQGACQCLYDQIVATIPFAEFQQVDRDERDRQASGETVQLPDDMDALRADCVAKSASTS